MIFPCKNKASDNSILSRDSCNDFNIDIESNHEPSLEDSFSKITKKTLYLIMIQNYLLFKMMIPNQSRIMSYSLAKMVIV